jgi:hypothetical protein
MPTTSVRRRISLLSRSSELFDYSWLQRGMSFWIVVGSDEPGIAKFWLTNAV